MNRNTRLNLFLLLVGAHAFVSRLFFVPSYFREGDQANMAFGISNLMKGVPAKDAFLYYYPVQAGYYKLMFFLEKLLYPADLLAIGKVMNYVSAFSGIGVLCVSYFIFRHLSERRVAIASLFFLSVMPVLWISSLYGNTSLPAMFLCCLSCLCLLKYTLREGGWRSLAGAVISIVCAITVRLDSALFIFPELVFILLFGRDRLKESLLYAGTLILAVLFSYYVFFGINLFSLLPVRTTSYLWDARRLCLYVVFGISPVIFILAGTGLFVKMEGGYKGRLFFLSWLLPFLIFYHGRATTPKYFLHACVPAAFLAGSAAIFVYDFFKSRILRSLSFASVILLVYAQTVVGLALDCKGVGLRADEGVRYNTDDGYFPFLGYWHFVAKWRRDGRVGLLGEIFDAADAMAGELESSGKSDFVIAGGYDDEFALKYFLSCRGFNIVAFDDSVLKKGGLTVKFIGMDSPADRENLVSLLSGRDKRVLISDYGLRYAVTGLPETAELRSFIKKDGYAFYECSSSSDENHKYRYLLLYNYFNARHRNVLMDELDTGDAESEKAHDYMNPAQNTGIVKKSLEPSNSSRVLISENGRAINDCEEFVINVDRFKDLFVVWRASPYNGRIWTKVFVNGNGAGEFKSANAGDKFCDLWLTIPAALIGSDRVRMKMVNEKGGDCVYGYHYWFYQRAFPDRFYKVSLPSRTGKI